MTDETVLAQCSGPPAPGHVDPHLGVSHRGRLLVDGGLLTGPHSAATQVPRKGMRAQGGTPADRGRRHELLQQGGHSPRGLPSAQPPSSATGTPPVPGPHGRGECERETHFKRDLALLSPGQGSPLLSTPEALSICLHRWYPWFPWDGVDPVLASPQTQYITEGG